MAFRFIFSTIPKWVRRESRIEQQGETHFTIPAQAIRSDEGIALSKTSKEESTIAKERQKVRHSQELTEYIHGARSAPEPLLVVEGRKGRILSL
jgi:hypothetical protein